VLVHFLASVTAPNSIGGKANEASIAPAIAGVFLCSVPLQVAIAFLCISAGAIVVLLWFDVCSTWWLSLFVPLSWPCSSTKSRRGAF
jgi:hypothetical protein